MFSYEEYYKLYNTRGDAGYHENVLKLKEHLTELSRQSETNGFRERMIKFSRNLGEYLSFICDAEEKWDDSYAKAASLKELKDDQEKMFGKLTADNYLQDIVSPQFMNQQARDIGPVLAMFAAEIVSGVEDAVKHRRFMLKEKIDLYFDLHKRISKGQVRAEHLSSLYNEYVHAHIERSVSMWMNRRFGASEEYFTQVVKEANFKEPYYLYEMGLPVGKNEENWRVFLNGRPEEETDRLADVIADRFVLGLYRENDNARGYRRFEGKPRYDWRNDQDDHVEFEVARKVVAIDYPMGTELLVSKIMNKLEAKGYVPFARNIRSSAISRLYLRDHEGDQMRALKEDKVKQLLEMAEGMAANDLSLLKGFAGSIHIVPPEQDEYRRLVEEGRKMRQQGGHGQRLGGRYSIGAAEEKRKKTREFWNELDKIMARKGGMEVASELTVCLPVMNDDLPEYYDRWIGMLTEEKPAERPIKAVGEAVDAGDFVYLQGKSVMVPVESGEKEEDSENAPETKECKTDLLIALRTLADPKKETGLVTSLGDGALPGGYAAVVPAMNETSGSLYLRHAVIDQVEYDDLMLTFEDGILTEYGCGNGKTPEDGRRFVRDNLLRGADEAVIAELTFGARQSRQSQDYQNGLGGFVPEEMRAGYDVSIVLGENRYERGEILRKNGINHKMTVVPEEKTEEKTPAEKKEAEQSEMNAEETQNGQTSLAEDGEVRAQTEIEAAEETRDTAETEKRRRYSYPLRARINIPYEQFSGIRVIYGDGSSEDIMRQGTFVLIGTDQMNMIRGNF